MECLNLSVSFDSFTIWWKLWLLSTSTSRSHHSNLNHICDRLVLASLRETYNKINKETRENLITPVDDSANVAKKRVVFRKKLYNWKKFKQPPVVTVVNFKSGWTKLVIWREDDISIINMNFICSSQQTKTYWWWCLRGQLAPQYPHSPLPVWCTPSTTWVVSCPTRPITQTPKKYCTSVGQSLKVFATFFRIRDKTRKHRSALKSIKW